MEKDLVLESLRYTQRAFEDYTDYPSYEFKQQRIAEVKQAMDWVKSLAPTRSIRSIKIGKRHRKELGDLTGLAQSIREIGLLHPIVITPEGELIAGQRRIEACKLLGWQEIPVRVLDLDDIVQGEHDENVVRKDFTVTEAVDIGRAITAIEETKARDRQNRRRFDDNCPVESTQQLSSSRDRVASYVGMGWQKLQRATEVVEAAEQEPQKFAPLVEEMDRTGRVNGVYKKLRVMRQAEEIRQEPPPMPAGPYRVIVIDPPWAYDNRAEDPAHRVANPYPSMSLEEIKAMPVGDLAADDCILWLWTTNAHLPVAFEVLRAWGFEYKTILTWVKDRMGTGDWLRGQTEHCLMAVRGKPVVTLTNQTTVINGPLREHSRKPDEFYQMVEALCPGSKVELFARTQRDGWASHGDQTALFGA